jgi:hypothetical protein
MDFVLQNQLQTTEQGQEPLSTEVMQDSNQTQEPQEGKTQQEGQEPQEEERQEGQDQPKTALFAHLILNPNYNSSTTLSQIADMAVVEQYKHNNSGHILWVTKTLLSMQDGGKDDSFVPQAVSDRFDEFIRAIIDYMD